MARLRVGAALATLALVAACGSPTAAPAGPSLVASIDVYGAIASAIGGSTVQVRSIIHTPEADPHDYEPTPSDSLAVSRANVVVYNGGGYDDFAAKLLDAADAKPIGIVVTAFSDFDTDAPDFNEHAWYDLPAMKKLADHLATALGTVDPQSGIRYLDNAKKFDAQIDALMAKVQAIKAEHGGTKVAITEPVPGYLLQAAGLVVVTPPEFSKAIEEGTDPPAAVVRADLATFTGPGKVKALVENAQTPGPTTAQAEQAATANGVPVVKVSETLPAGVTDYVIWMNRQVDALAAALDAP
jgi:zinc/manganese transport system substrate-binding protein